MPDLLDEDLIPLTEAAKLFPRPPHTSTLVRWAQRGCRHVRLETWLIGGRRYTTREAIRRFIASTTAAGTPGAPLAQTSGHLERIEAELESEGI